MISEKHVEAVPEEVSSSKRQSLDTAAPYNFNDPMFSSDEFRMWEMKIRKCPRARPHDWTMCPFAHPGEKAKRRDPRKFQYSGSACADYRKTGHCARGDACCFSHGVFECWLHPSRYRSQLCTDGTNCKRRVCFFAHRECELRQLPEGSPASAPGSQLQADLAVEAACLQSQSQISQVLHSFLEQQKRAQQEHAVTAAAQLLDPLAKLRLMKSLQQQQQQSSITTTTANRLAEMNLDARQHRTHVSGIESAALAAFPLGTSSMASMNHRQSLDGMYGGGGRGGAIPEFQGTDASVPHSNLSRKSVDIGSLSRNMDMSHFGESTAPSAYPGPEGVGVPHDPHPMTASVFNAGMGMGIRDDSFTDPTIAIAIAADHRGSYTHTLQPSAPTHCASAPLLLGSLPTASYMEFAAGHHVGAAATGASAARGAMAYLSSAGDVHRIGNFKARSVVDAVGPKDNPTAQSSSSPSQAQVTERGPSGCLQSIDESGPLETEEEPAAEGGSSSSSVIVNSCSAASSLDASACEPTVQKASIPHVVSFDNILAELPRSSSQVNMVGLGNF